LRSKGREEGQARAQAGWGIGARHGSARLSPWHATAVLGVRVGRECRVERPRSIAEEPRTGRGEHGAWPATLTRTAASAQQKQGREGESREGREKEREKNLIEFKFESSSKFSNNTRKFLNMKDVPKFQILPLLFQAYFHLGPNSKVQFESRQM